MLKTAAVVGSHTMMKALKKAGVSEAYVEMGRDFCGEIQTVLTRHSPEDVLSMLVDVVKSVDVVSMESKFIATLKVTLRTSHVSSRYRT